MIYAEPNTTFNAVLEGAPTGLLGTLGVRIVTTAGTAVVARTTAGITEPVTSVYVAALTAPAAIDEYLVVWDDGVTFTSEQLTVSGFVASPLAGAPTWAPTVQEVAQVVPAYTRGGFDDEGQWAGAPNTDPVTAVPTFTATTSPTITHVEALIVAACEEVIGRVGVAIPVEHYGLARTAAKWHVAAMIAAGKMPADTDDASGEYRSHIANFRASLDELVKLARMGATRLA